MIKGSNSSRRCNNYKHCIAPHIKALKYKTKTIRLKGEIA